ncbi:MAG: type IV secretory system conjugative DNA transfer family protein [Ahrensia sp.]|nr:type IV secretory system conjugative DNA transfer family protein [Ahrensia sp.]
MTFDGRPIFEPKPSHSMLLAPSGDGKTTCGAVPYLLSMIADHSKAIVVVDSKEGEISAQCAELCRRYGRKVAILDDFGVLEKIEPETISLNPFGSLIEAHHRDAGEFVFAAESANRALIEEPSDGDSRNLWFRDEPRTLIEYAQTSLLSRRPELATPGAVFSLLSNPKLLIDAANVDADEGDEHLAALARHVVDMSKDEEHFPQHRGTAVRACRIFGPGSRLHQVGVDIEKSHSELLAQKYVIFLVGPQRHMERLGSYYALHLQSFLDSVMSGEVGATEFIVDEFSNCPLKELVSRLTTMRGYGGRVHMIAQSRSEIQRKYGEKETQTIEENAVVKQYFGFSSIEEAERISKAIGESQVITHSLSVNSEKQDFSGNYQTAKERLVSADELMRLPKDQQIMHVKGVGWIHCKKISQQNIGPYAGELRDSNLEGSRLEPNIMIELPTGDREVAQ